MGMWRTQRKVWLEILHWCQIFLGIHALMMTPVPHDLRTALGRIYAETETGQETETCWKMAVLV